jgi:hypothetical protein
MTCVGLQRHSKKKTTFSRLSKDVFHLPFKLKNSRNFFSCTATSNENIFFSLPSLIVLIYYYKLCGRKNGVGKFQKNLFTPLPELTEPQTIVQY